MGGSKIDGVGGGGKDFGNGGVGGDFGPPAGEGPQGRGNGGGEGGPQGQGGIGRGESRGRGEGGEGQPVTNRGEGKHADGPGNNGRGHANGHDKAGRHETHDAGKPARAHEIDNQVQQVRSRIENLTRTNQPPGNERLPEEQPGRDPGRDITQTRGDGTRADDGEVRLRSHVGDERARVGEGDDGGSRRSRFEGDDNGRGPRFEGEDGRGRRYDGDDDRGRWHNRDDDGGRRNRFEGDDAGRRGRMWGEDHRGRGDNWRFDSSGPGRHGRGHAYGHDKHSQGPFPLDTLANTVAGTLGRTTGALADLVRDLGHTLKHESRPLLESAAAFLRGQTDGADLPPETRAALRTAADALGPEFLRQLDDRRADKVFKVVERALEHLNRAVEHAQRRGEDFVRLPGDVRVPLERATRVLGHAPAAHGQSVREMVDELLGAALLNRHLKHLEKTGGHVVSQAEARIAHALYGTTGDGPRPTVFVHGGHTTVQPRPHPQEILRDLRAGAFLPPQEQYNPFPLTGRARVAAEMMELMRTLDAVEGALQRAAALGGEGQKAQVESSFAAWLQGGLAGAVDGALEELLSLVLPTLPGRAGRWEIPRLVAELNGLLTDASGRALLARDGTPLKLDRLLWLGAAGGLLGTLFGPGVEGENAPARLSPMVVYGFDALYSVVGFDGRTLASPHFVAVQSAVNNSEFEWVFGQEPFTDGWARELIERLKDSVVVEHNLLGEMLEEALADGRFHVALLSVEVEEGAPVPEATSVTRLLPGAAGAVAFA